MTTNNNLPVEPIKIFGENAGQNIGQFGSALTGTPNRTGDIEQIQALNAWGNGWAGGVISKRNYPALEEMTGIQKVLSYHLAYIKQKGICEWDSTVTYFANTGFCQVNGVVYQSITDNNIGNNPTEDKESTHWKKVDLGGANTDLSNLTEEGEKHFLNKAQVTNCPLEVPQRINVEINNGTLTLKAGSVVIVPYGTSEPTLEIGASLNGGEIVDISWDEQKLFYYVKYDEEFNISFTSSGTYVDYLCMSPSGANINASNFVISSSGTQRPSSPLQYTLWYDTTNNIVEFCDGTTWLQYQSLPFATANVVNGVGYSSIQNIFNGFGFIGSTIWCDKGVKGLVPNGRNADGSLNNIEAATNNAIISNISKSGRSDYAHGRFIFMNHGLGFIDVKGYHEVEKYAQIPFSQAYSLTYVKNENRMYRVKPDLSVVEEPFVVTGNFEIDFSGESPKVTQITSIPKPFRALDYNNTAFIAAQSMPANGEFISLTPGGDVKYTAPGTGCFCAEGVMGAAGKFISLYNQNTGWNATSFAGRADNYVCVYLPCIAGQTAVLSSDNIARITKFGFMFSEGSL